MIFRGGVSLFRCDLQKTLGVREADFCKPVRRIATHFSSVMSDRKTLLKISEQADEVVGRVTRQMSGGPAACGQPARCALECSYRSILRSFQALRAMEP